ncbi:ribokinase [Salipaludibacillus sp. CF4.18]|uniref:ribokinase n=1 Tax=Salipaludibacillus sp. CF4.18 TaxID=3373081 RepID=UPI003EE4F490
MKRRSLTVVGSINMDMVTTTEVVPSKGETVLGESFTTAYGGKGANQAVAAARLGADVRIIGRVGSDPFGSMLKQGLTENGVTTDSVNVVENCSSGVATIILSDRDNRIIVTPGANEHVTKEYVEQFNQEIVSSDVVLLQLEIPLETVNYVLDLCFDHGVQVILNPAPVQNIAVDKLKKVTFLTPNESEWEAFGELSLQEQSWKEKVIVTRGARGASFYANRLEVLVSGYQVNPVDTTGAGDTFNGALAVAVAEGRSIEEAVRFANAAAALSVQSFGAQGGMPNREQVIAFIEGS